MKERQRNFLGIISIRFLLNKRGIEFLSNLLLVDRKQKFLIRGKKRRNFEKVDAAIC